MTTLIIPFRKTSLIMAALLWLMASSCNGQADPRSKKENDGPVAAHPSTFEDPLFFIDGQLCQHLRKIYQDKASHLWLGTNVYGLMRYDGDTLEYITEQEGFSGGRVTGIAEDNDGNLWLATGFGLNKYDGHSFTNYTQDGVIGGVEAGGFFEDNNGDIWFGVENNGVYRYDGKAFKHYEQEDLSGASVLSIYRDREGRLWFGGWGGLFRYDHGSFTPVTVDGPWK